jgi:hypothetical protein
MRIDADMHIDAAERTTIRKWISKWKGGPIVWASADGELNFSPAPADLKDALALDAEGRRYMSSLNVR